MLIIPLQNKPDWRRPPLMCFALIAINLLVFVFYQGGDEARWQKAENYYFSSDLPELEEQRFLIYVNEVRPEWRTQVDAQGEDFVYRELLWNPEFHHWLVRHLKEEGEAEWLAQRQHFAKLRDRLSSIAYGLVPAEPRPSGLIGHMFLHGSWDHLIGNMVFLLLFGLSVELALGGLWFAGLYLAGGLAAAGLHMAVEAGSPVPMVGASGAVSAVMGMFVAVYGVRRMRFFYTIGFIFGEFSAPALMVLPLWLAKEIFGYFYGDAGIAYWAHTGGLLAGFVFTLILFSYRPAVKQMPMEDEPPSPQQGAIARIDRFQEEGKLLEAAQAATMAIRQYPQSLPLIERAIALTASAPESEAYHRANLALFALADNTEIDARALSNGYHRYLQTSTNPRALTPKACLLLARRAAREHDWAWLEALLRRLLRQRVDHPLLPKLGMTLVNHYRRVGEEAQAREILDLLQLKTSV
ncbi:rhomboid family intramembrane serine protease [Microbulbifer thermotolerans]|uniref:rhomboid family intramembrane serine protease n=1 Tax=Microbulbifer thermotolerans TaxID=252514 RepID=UPI002673FAD9|nr:rhomboid family intramembrane serine protease [Microbulbifer thermotolerans]WKT60958.1 rhomboid family intramembrane serine protease [Microbulbifer thermotolerans]